MNACMLAYTFYETDNRVRRYAEALAKRGNHVEAVVLRRNKQARYEVIRGVHVHRIQLRNIDEKGPLSYLVKLLIFLCWSGIYVTYRHLVKRYHIVHVHSVPDFEVFAAVIPRLWGAQVILDIHDIVPEFYDSKFKVGVGSAVFQLLVMIERVSAAFSSHVIISNHLWYSRLIQRSVAPEKCTVLINYPDRSMFYKRYRAHDNGDRFYVCYPGTLNEHQGVDLAIHAIARLRDEDPRVFLRIIGDGPDREKLQELIQRYQLQERITITGLVPAECVAEMMADVDLGIVPKRNSAFGGEAFSTKILEFMAMGIPVLVSRTRIDQLYFNDSIVQFTQPDDVEELAKQILTLARDPVRRGALVRAAAEFVGGNNWDVKQSEYLKLVDRLIKCSRMVRRQCGQHLR